MKETELIPALTADDRVLALFANLQAKKAEVAGAERPVYITGGQFRYSTNSPSGTIDITVERNISKLKEIWMFLNERASHNAPANEFFGIQDPFKWQNFTVEEWERDLKTRANFIQLKERKAELQVLEDRINRVVSPELRRQMEMDAIEAELSK
jgi:hypothetical protein